MVPVVLGMVARVRFPALPSPDLALPMVLSMAFRQPWGARPRGRVLRGIESADAALFMLTTSLSQDLYRRFVAPDAPKRKCCGLPGHRRRRRHARRGGRARGRKRHHRADIFYTLMSVSLFVPILAGLYCRGRDRRRRSAHIVAGITAVVLRQFVSAARASRLTPRWQVSARRRWSSSSCLYLGGWRSAVVASAFGGSPRLPAKAGSYTAKSVASAFRRKSPPPRIAGSYTRT